MALRTSNGTGGGLWSAAGTWDTGVPVNNDTFLIRTGDVVIFDVDQSGMANGMGASTIALGGNLIASTDPGSYFLKMNADLTLNGLLAAGTSTETPYPSTCTFTISFNSTANSIECGATGKIYLYCTEPAYKYVNLSAPEAIGQTELSVDTNVTGDIWADGDTVIICDVAPTGMPEIQTTTIAAGGIAAATITVTSSLTAAKNQGAYIILRNRNIKLTSSTDYVIRFNVSSTDSYVGAEISGCGFGVNGGVSHTISGTISGCSYGVTGGTSHTVSGVISACTYGAYVGALHTFSGTICGCSYGVYSGTSHTISGTIAGCNNGVYGGTSWTISGTISGSIYGVYYGMSHTISGVISGCSYGIAYGDNYVLSSSLLSNTNDLYRIYGGISNNTLLGGTTEFNGYTLTGDRGNKSYFASYNHDQVTNAFRAWCLGGIVSSQTASPPSGYSIWYQHACESASYPCFRQYQVSVKPDETLNVEALIRLQNGDNHAAYPPRLQIIDFFLDPLVDPANNPLDEDQVTESNGSINSDWQEVVCSYVNQGDSEKIVLVRIIAKHATGLVDEVWSLPDYKTQVQAIYDKLPTNNIMGSSVKSDIDDEIDAILEDTGTTLPVAITNAHSVTDGKIDVTDGKIAVTDGKIDAIKAKTDKQINPLGKIYFG